MQKIICNKKYDIDMSKIPDLLEFILTKNGIKDTQKFKNPTRVDIHDPFIFRDMDKALDFIKEIIKKKKFGIVIDPDVDGLTSAATMVNFLKDNFNVEYIYFIPYGKSHGLDEKRMEEIKNSECKYIIIPDAGSSDINQCKELMELGKKILIIDHHGYTDESIRKYATLINCTDGSYPNVNLSGATVVQKTIDAFVEKYSKEYNLNREQRDKYLDLVSLGTIADSIDLANPEARYYAVEGLKPKYENNECIKEICLQAEYEMKMGKTIKTIGFNIAPCMNAIVRYGKPADEKKGIQSEFEILFRALINEQETFVYQPRRKCTDDPKPESQYHSLQKTSARLATNAHSRQFKAVSILVDKLVDKVDKTSQVVIVNATEDMEDQDKNSTGLVANKLMTRFGKPAFVLNGKGGSGRSNAIGRLVNARDFFNSSGLIEAQGHPRAFGIKSLPSVKAFLDFCNKNILDEELVNASEVDFEVAPDKIRQKDINEIGKYLSLFGSSVPAPIFFIPGIEITSDKIEPMNKEDSDYISSFSFKYNGIEFGKSYCKKEDFNEITCKPATGFGKPKPQKLKIDVICEVHNRLTDEGDIISSLRINNFYSESLGFVDDKNNKVSNKKDKIKDDKKNVPFFF